MSVAKIAISLDTHELAKVDRLVREGKFPSRSKLIQDALAEKLDRLKGNRLAQECQKLDRTYEKSMADEGLASEISEWPEY